MGRSPRRASSTSYYHVMARGNQRQAIFWQPADYTTYCTFLHMAFRTWQISLAHFCLMPNHVHLLVHASTVTSLSKAMHQVQRRYWFHIRRFQNWTGHAWQSRFRSIPIEDEAYLLQAARYIERNPLAAHLVTDVAEYPWSSYRYYALGRASIIPLTPTPVYEALAASRPTREAAYRCFVTTPQPSDQSKQSSVPGTVWPPGTRYRSGEETA